VTPETVPVTPPSAPIATTINWPTAKALVNAGVVAGVPVADLTCPSRNASAIELPSLS